MLMDAGRRLGVLAERFSTASLPRAQAIDGWRARMDAWVEVQVPEPSGPGFLADSVTWHLGPIALCWTRGDGLRSVRDARRIRRDQLDHYLFALARSGEMRGVWADRSYLISSVVPTVGNMAQVSVCDRGASEWLMMFVARDALADCAPMLDRCMGEDLQGPLGRLLGAHMNALPQELGSLDPADAPALAQATLSLVRAAVASAQGRLETPAPPLEMLLRTRVRELIRAQLGSARLDPARVAKLSGVSRTQLYRIMEAEGGVARAIQRERLAAVRRALADPHDRRPIWAVAEANGLHDASGFSRAFRREFGTTPREFRAEAACAMPLAPPRDIPKDSLRGLLQGLRC